MPMMVRYDKRATKIAFKILGTPAPFKNREKDMKSKAYRRLIFEDTARVR